MIFPPQIIKAPRAFADRTSISGGIDFAIAQLARAPFHANRHCRARASPQRGQITKRPAGAPDHHHSSARR
jgi:hypothetical protein